VRLQSHARPPFFEPVRVGSTNQSLFKPHLLLIAAAARIKWFSCDSGIYISTHQRSR